MTMTPEYWTELMDRYLVGGLEEEEFSRLEEAMKADEELRKRFVFLCAVDASLREEAAREVATPTEVRCSQFSSRLLWTTVGIAASVLLYLGFSDNPSKSPPSVGLGHFTSETTAAGKVGVLAKAIDSGPDWQSGATLYQGEFRAEEGLFELNLNNGVVILARGPVHLDLRDPMEIFCYRGSLRFRVPAQAKGFRILTSEREIIDHGTEFGVQVDETSSQVKVFEGEIELVDPDQPSRRMFQGDQDQWGEQPVAANYPRIEQLNSSFENHAALRRKQWNEFLEVLKNDQALRLLYDFRASGPWGKTIANEAPGAPPETDGAIIGCQPAEGRWPGSHAIEFSKGTDTIRIHEPRKYQSISMATWVRLDSLDRRYNSLLTTEDWDDNGIDWEISHNGRPLFHPKSGPNFDHSQSTVNRSVMGQWILLAFTYDNEAGIGRHYLNGLKLMESRKQKRPVLNISYAQIGNWNTIEKREFRNLNGRMDFLAVWDRALSEEEISLLYQKGAVER